MIKKAIIAAFNLLFLTISLGTGVYFVRQSQDVRSSASSVTAMSLETDSLSYTVGDRITVQVRVDGAKQAVGFVDAMVDYDPKILSGISVSSGDYFAKHQVLGDEIDNRTGKVRYKAQVASGTPPSVGRGTVAIIVFDVLAAGQSKLDVAPNSVAAATASDTNVLQSTSELMVTTVVEE